MRRQLGAALVAGALVFGACGGDSEETPRAFETKGPVEHSWDKARPVVDRIKAALDRMVDDNETGQIVTDLIDQTVDDNEYTAIHRTAQAIDRQLTNLFEDDGPVVRSRDIANDLLDYVTGDFDDGTVGKALKQAESLQAEVEDLMGNNAVATTKTLVTKLLNQVEKVSDKVQDQQTLSKVRDLAKRLDAAVDRLFDDGGTVDEVYEWTIELVQELTDLLP